MWWWRQRNSIHADQDEMFEIFLNQSTRQLSFISDFHFEFLQSLWWQKCHQIWDLNQNVLKDAQKTAIMPILREFWSKSDALPTHLRSLIQSLLINDSLTNFPDLFLALGVHYCKLILISITYSTRRPVSVLIQTGFCCCCYSHNTKFHHNNQETKVDHSLQIMLMLVWILKCVQIEV